MLGGFIFVGGNGMESASIFFLVWALFLGLCFSFDPSILSFDHPYACGNSCGVPITWTSPLLGCAQDGNTYENKLGNTTVNSYFQCMIKNIGLPHPNIGFSYPGNCSCPNYCSDTIEAGYCDFDHCECYSGWKGPDCSQVTIGNNCSSVGHVLNITGVETCYCDKGYAMNDCSAAVGPLPPITQTVVPVQQYTDRDEYRDNHPIFNSTTIAQIKLTMPPETLYFQQDPENRQSRTYFPVDMWFYNNAMVKQMSDVGFRLKGGASRSYFKKSFKLSFNKFDKGRKWAQQKKLELKAMQQDESAIKEILCLSMLYSMNAPAQRYAYTQLFINEQYMGAYLMLESIDDQFLESRFGNSDGELYKCAGDLEYLGMDPDLYKNATYVPGKLSYRAETDAAEADYTKLRNFIKVLNVTSDATFVTLLPTIFDVDLFARTLAVEVLSGGFDGIYNANNYYLYFNPDPKVSKFQYFRHDVSTSFGVWNTFYPMVNSTIYSWGDGGRGYRLINRFLANEPFRSLITDYILQLIDTYYHFKDDFVDRMDFLNFSLRPFILPDKWRSTDFGYGYEGFVNRTHQGQTIQTGANVAARGVPSVHSFGIKEYMAARIASAIKQLR